MIRVNYQGLASIANFYKKEPSESRVGFLSYCKDI